MKKFENPAIRELAPKILIGLNAEMSLAEDETAILWSKFMPRLKEVENRLAPELISLQVYPSGYFKSFDPHRSFTKWALAEVAENTSIPQTLGAFTLQGGMYAVFNYRGSSQDKTIFQYIYGTWIPNSEYVLDARPHFEVLGEKYKNNDPNSEEEIWIPVRPKNT